MICQLHAVLAELVPAGAATHLTTRKASALLRTSPDATDRRYESDSTQRDADELDLMR